MRQPNLFLVDDEPDVTNSLRWLLESVGLTATAFNLPQQFLRFLATCSGPCCTILDLRMPGLTGIEVLERVTSLRPDASVVFLTGHSDVPTAVRAMKLGAFDFLVKPFNPQSFLECINRACKQAQDEYELVYRRRCTQEALARLTSRERQIFDCVIGGMSSKEIGRVLHISPKTVDVHRASIMKKMGVASTRELNQKFQAVAGDRQPAHA